MPDSTSLPLRQRRYVDNSPSNHHFQPLRTNRATGRQRPGASAARPLAVDSVYLGDPWLKELHREKITGFWSLYLERRPVARSPA
jgi:hypothetical protein